MDGSGLWAACRHRRVSVFASARIQYPGGCTGWKESRLVIICAPSSSYFPNEMTEVFTLTFFN